MNLGKEEDNTLVSVDHMDLSLRIERELSVIHQQHLEKAFWSEK